MIIIVIPLKPMESHIIVLLILEFADQH